MPRLNIEDSIFKDIRFIDLCIKLGGMDQALGALVRSWMLAQKWYTTPEKLIPAKEWQAAKLPAAVIDVGLAEPVGDKIRMKGVDDQFKWLSQRIEAGRRGGLKSQEKRASGRSAVAKQNEPSFSFSSSSSFSSSDSHSNSNSKNKEEDMRGSVGNEDQNSGASAPTASARKRSECGPIPDLESELSVYVLKGVSKNLQETWLKAYPSAEWLKIELNKAHVWMEANPQRKPKNFGRFMSNWLSRAFEDYRKGIKSRPLTNSERNAASISDMYQKVKRGEL